ncbi:TIGR01906 family membrane protein [Anaerocolumna aminovalerica]|uniref:Integral membrane protein TIGR01906 n=1 Tax=Anaerocolumna aminovalerica TaxID=1527 RepID=A0A1I5DY77_9FIRM|nr:TIGR01906 family membrane protein [Anaerocolumna aminovalerica]SFO04136.1 integral membrane protein TIGR01906 [Anaerocolumna aminovalerica]
MRKFKITDILIGFVFTLLFISIGVIAAVNFRFIYYLDIDRLNISQTSGLEKDVIIENYDALIRYNSPFYKGDLKLPGLPSSPGGLQHFAEVKTIFTAFYYIAAISIIISLLIIFYKRSKKDNSYLLVSSITVLVIPVIAALGSIINFDAIFLLFHKIFFRNDLWIFDPAKDPVITILPATFFLHSLLVIIAFVLLGSILLLISYFWTNSRVQYRRRRTIYYK